MNWRSFFLGGITVIVFGAASQWSIQPKPKPVEWPDDDRAKVIKALAPWVSDAVASKVGSFWVLVANKSPETPRMILRPVNGSFPSIISVDSPQFELRVIDSKQRLITIGLNEATGEFGSVQYAAKLFTGNTFIDNDLDGEWDMKVGGDQKISVKHNSKWVSVVIKDHKKLIVDGSVFREIETGLYGWRFKR